MQLTIRLLEREAINQDTEVHFIGAIAQEALDVGYGKDKSAMLALVKDFVHNVGNDYRRNKKQQ